MRVCVAWPIAESPWPVLPGAPPRANHQMNRLRRVSTQLQAGGRAPTPAPAAAAVVTRNHMVIAGATGLAGRAAVEHFAAHPDWEVTCLSRRIPDYDLLVHPQAICRCLWLRAQF